MATATTEKDIAYYLEHPEEVDPANTELVQKLLAAEGDTSGTEGKATTTETDDAGKAAKAPDAKTDDAKAAADKGKATPSEDGETLEAKASGILTADGKHVIPMSVLQQAREAGAAAEGALRDMTENYLALERLFKALQTGKAAPVEGASKTADEMEADLKAIEEEAPWMVEHFKRLLTAQRALEDRVAELTAERQDDQAAYTNQLQVDATKALEANATLLLWKADAPKLFEEAAAFDVYLRKHPEESKRYVREDGSIDFAGRYEDSVALVRAKHRNEEIPLPKAVEAKDGGKAKADAEKTREVAKRKLADADSGVTTMSDLPGGAPAAQSETEAIEDESITALGNRLYQMPPDKLQAWLSRNG